ncbi:MAG: hypothetical protein Q7W30_02780 [Coriobacteriia bacterium]|nr:hypothetical protein [Coriobacteriia bacterium]
MGKLYEACRQITDEISRAGLDKYRTRGLFALETGFLITLVSENDPDDPEKIAKLRDAARKILGMELSI